MSQSLERAIRILYGAVDGPITVGQVAKLLEVHHSTALRLLQTLREGRLVTKLPDGRYRLGSGVIWIASRALEQLDLRQIARPFLTRLAEETTETVHLAVQEDAGVVYIDKVESQHPVRMYSRVGALAKWHCSGVSKAILAFTGSATRDKLIDSIPFPRFTSTTLTTPEELRADLELSRQRGYALDAEEHEQGIQWIAAPVFDAADDVVASISVSAPTARVDKEQLLAFVPSLLSAAADLSAELGHRPTRRGEIDL